MICTQAPYRISFFGGGTDYEEWYGKHGGAFLSTAIDHHINIVVRKKPALDIHKYRVVWRELENVNSRSAVKHPFVRAALEKRNIEAGLDIVYFGQLPHGAGIGSSSTFGAAFLTAINSLTKHSQSPESMAQEIYEIENKILKETVGVQDQWATSVGGFNFGEISKDGSVTISPITIDQNRLKSLNNNLYFVFSGNSRHASTIAASQIRNFGKKKNVLHKIQNMAYEARSILESSSSLDDFGHLLHENWLLKRSISDDISTPVIESMYEKAISAGALGGKLLGAGGGGFMVFYVPQKAQKSVSTALKGHPSVPVSINAPGAEVLMNIPQKYTEQFDQVWELAYGKQSQF